MKALLLGAVLALLSGPALAVTASPLPGAAENATEIIAGELYGVRMGCYDPDSWRTINNVYNVSGQAAATEVLTGFVTAGECGVFELTPATFDKPEGEPMDILDVNKKIEGTVQIWAVHVTGETGVKSFFYPFYSKHQPE